MRGPTRPRTIVMSLLLACAFACALVTGGCSSVLGLKEGEHDPTMDTPCGLCLRKQCGAELDACIAEPACQVGNTCVGNGKCPYPSTCFDDCVTSSGTTTMQPYYDCGVTRCAAACN